MEQGVYAVQMRALAPALTTCRRDATAVVVQEEFDKVVAERGMAAKLNRLDALLESRELVEGQTL